MLVVKLFCLGEPRKLKCVRSEGLKGKMTWTRVEEAMKELVWEEKKELVVRLAERYSFEASEALKWLGEEPSREAEKSSGKKVGERIIPSIPLPFCGVVNNLFVFLARLSFSFNVIS